MDEKISMYNPETDTLIEITVSPEDAIRAQNDIMFATSLMDAAVKEQMLPSADPASPVEDFNNISSPSSVASPESAVEIEDDEGVNGGKPEEDGGSLYRWTTPCVLLLLETYKCVETKLQNGKQSQKKIWEEVAQKLKQQGHIVTGPQCAAKLRSLKKTYKSVTDHNNKSGNDRRTWQFYEIMDEIFSKKAWCAPVALASSSGLSVKQDGGSRTQSNSGCASETPSKLNVSSLLAKRMRQKEDQETARAKRHCEKMAMDAKLLAVLEKLANK